MTPEEREQMQMLREVWQNAQQQVRTEKARNGTLDPETPQRTAAQLAALQAHVNQLWEKGGKLRRGDGDNEIACEVCKGARRVQRGGTVGLPVYIHCPACWQEWYASQVRRRWRLTDKELELTHKPFNRRPDAPQMANAYKTVKAFGERVIAGTADMLALTGTVGIGKTHLMLLLYRQVDAAERAVIYRTATSIQRILQNFGYDDESRREAEHRRTIAMNDLTKAPLLILDEAEKATGEWFENQMLDIINIRRNNRLATALAGNDLFKLPAPVVSRARAQGCDFLALGNVADARPLLEIAK